MSGRKEGKFCQKRSSEKKFEKNGAKIWRECGRVLIFASAFASERGGAWNQTKEVL